MKNTYTLHELTQGMAEALIDALPDGTTPTLKYQRLFVEAAISAGWLELPTPPVEMLRADLASLFGMLSKRFSEANSVPNE